MDNKKEAKAPFFLSSVFRMLSSYNYLIEIDFVTLKMRVFTCLFKPNVINVAVTKPIRKMPLYTLAPVKITTATNKTR